VSRLLPAIVFLAVLGPPSTASAEDVGGVEDAPLVRQELQLRGKRHELTTSLGMSMNDAFVRGWAPTVGYAYYLTNWFGVGADIHANLCAFGVDCRTALAERIQDVDPNLRSGGLDDVSVLSTLVTPYATLVPISGKVGVVGGHIVHWDMNLFVGGALVLSDNAGDGDAIEASSTLAPMIGVGQRFFIDESMAITLSLRDYIINRALNASTAGEDTGAAPVSEEIDNRFFLGLGVSFFFPSAVTTSR